MNTTEIKCSINGKPATMTMETDGYTWQYTIKCGGTVVLGEKMGTQKAALDSVFTKAGKMF
jgi:hypothetical protein